MRAALLLFAMLSLLLLTIFLLSQPPLEIIANNTASTAVGPRDTSTWGSSLVYYELERQGYNISTSPGPGRVTVLLGIVDTDSVAATIIPGAARIAEEQGTAIIVVSTNSPTKLVRRASDILEGLGWQGPSGRPLAGMGVVILQRPELAVSPSGNLWPVKAVYYFSVLPTGPGVGDRFSAISLVPEDPKKAAAIQVTFEKSDSRLVVVLLSDPESFTNMVVYPLLERGISPGPYLRDILTYEGAPPGTTLSAPLLAFKPRELPASNPAPLRLETRSIFASMLATMASQVDALFSRLAGSPLAMLGLGLAGLLAGYIIGRGIAGTPLAGGALAPVRPVEPVRSLGLSREFALASSVGGRLERLSKADAKRVIAALYELADTALERLYGVSLEEAAAKGMLAPREGAPLTGDPELDRVLERLLVIYKRKVLASKLLPLVNIRKEAARLYRALLPFLDRARIRLEGERGVEYTGV